MNNSPNSLAQDIREQVKVLNELMEQAKQFSMHVYISADGNWNGDGKNGKVELPSTPILTVHRIKQQLEF